MKIKSKLIHMPTLKPKPIPQSVFKMLHLKVDLVKFSNVRH